MPKRALEIGESEDGNTSLKPTKVINVAYGEYNKAGDTIPSDPVLRLRKEELPEKKLTVVAWNLNGIRSFVEKRGQLLKTLWESEDVDILGITEHKVTDENRAQEVETSIRKILHGHDVKFIWNMCSVKKGYAGSLAVIKGNIFTQIEKTSFGFNKTDPEGRVITLEFKHAAVVIVYVPNSGMQLERLQYRINTWDKDFSNYCVALSKSKSVIIAGDMNVAHRDVDIYNVDAAHIPKLAGTTPQERNSFQTQFLDKGFVDTFACMHPKKKGWFSYWSVKAKNKPRNRGLRLDYVLADRSLKLLDAYISSDLSKEGDHCPIGLVVELDQSNI